MQRQKEPSCDPVLRHSRWNDSMRRADESVDSWRGSLTQRNKNEFGAAEATPFARSHDQQLFLWLKRGGIRTKFETASQSRTPFAQGHVTSTGAANVSCGGVATLSQVGMNSTHGAGAHLSRSTIVCFYSIHHIFSFSLFFFFFFPPSFVGYSSDSFSSQLSSPRSPSLSAGKKENTKSNQITTPKHK